MLTIKEADDLHNDYNLLKRIPKECKVYRTHTIDFWRIWRRRSERKKSTISENGNKKPIQMLSVNSKKINWLRNIKNFFWDLVTIPDHMVFWIPFATIKGVKILKKEKCEVIYTSSPPHSEHIIGFILSKIFRKTWIADFRDPWLDNFNYNPSNLRLIFDRILERLVVNNSSRIIMASNYYKKSMSKRYPSSSGKLSVIHNGFDPELYNNVSGELFPKFTILYTGNFYGSIKPDYFLKGVRKWLNTQEPDVARNIQILFYGLGSDSEKELLITEKLSDIVQLGGQISHGEIIRKQKGADLLLLIIGFEEKNRGVVTSKAFEYIASGRPILAIMPDGEQASILRSYSNVYWVNKEDYAILINCLSQAYNNYSKHHNKLRFPSQKMYLNKNSPYDATRQTRNLVKIFMGVLSR